MNVAGNKDVGRVLDDHIIRVFGRERSVAAVGWSKMSFSEHELHDLGRLVIAEGLDVGGVVEEALAMITEDLDAVEAEVAGIAEEDIVGAGEQVFDLSFEGGLRLSGPDRVVVAGLDDDGDVVWDELELGGERLVLIVDVGDGEFFLLAGVDADTVDQVSGEDEVFQAAGNIPLAAVAEIAVDPTKKHGPFVLHEHLAADVDVTEEGGADGGLGVFAVVLHLDVREDDVLDEDEVALFAELADHPDHFIEHDFAGEREDLSEALQRHEGDAAGLIFEFNDPVSFGG